jgi:hypothetical protein
MTLQLQNSNITPNMFDSPLTAAALRKRQLEHQHTVLHPEGIKSSCTIKNVVTS